MVRLGMVEGWLCGRSGSGAGIRTMLIATTKSVGYSARWAWFARTKTLRCGDLELWFLMEMGDMR